MRKKLHRLLRLVPIALAFAASVASAQTTGTIVGVVTDASTGKPVAGALVVATSPNLQAEQTAVTDATGNYRLTLLPPGQYKLAVQLEGYKPAERGDILLRVDKTLKANLAVVPEAVFMDEQVIKTGLAPVINLGTAETGSVVSKEFMATIPVTRGFEGTAVSSPMAQRDLYGVSFAGATSPENNYILDGMRITDPTVGVLGTNILTNFVDQVDVKTGSFLPEYGHTSSGIVSVVTKSGSNEFHGSVWGNYTPGALSPASQGVGRVGEAIAWRPVPYDGGYEADFGFEIGGPILKDRLWFFAGFAPVLYNAPYERYLRGRVDDGTGQPARDSNGVIITNRLPGGAVILPQSSTTYQIIGKLTYLISEDHNLALSFLTTPTQTQGPAGFNGNESSQQISFDSASTDLIARYSGRALDKHLLLEVTAGWHGQTLQDTPNTFGTLDSGTTPFISWRQNRRYTFFDPNATSAGCNATGFNNCVVNLYATGGYGFEEKIDTNRYAGRAAVSYLFDAAGSHNLKAGLDADYSIFDDTRDYSGDVVWRLRVPGTASTANSLQMYRAFGSTDGINYIHAPMHSKPDTLTMGYFLQDSWTIANVLTLNFGLRWETQSMTDPLSAASPTLSINDMVAPRVQAIWDFTGTGRGKVQGNWGRFYESIPLDLAARAFGNDVTVAGARVLSTCVGGEAALANGGNPLQSCPDVYGLAPGTAPIGAFSGSTPYATLGGISPVAPDLKGQYVDMFGGGVEYEVIQDLSVGVEYAGRRLGNIIEDMSTDNGNNYFIANPSVSNPWNYTAPSGAVTHLDPRQGLSLDSVTNMYYMGVFPAPIRSYDGFTIKVQKNLSKQWMAMASYTYSSFRGNYPGLFRSENAQLDPNLTSEYDLVSLLGNKYGPMAADKPHQVKLYGSYNWDISPKFNAIGGVGFNAASGTPANALGADPNYGDGEAFIVPRGMAGRLPWLINLDLHGEVGYVVTAPYTVKFTVDVFNVLNEQTVQYVDQRYTLDFVQPMQAAQCANKDSITQGNPITAIQNDCPDIKYLKTTDGRPATVNGTFGRPQAGPTGSHGFPAPAYQAPIRVRFGLMLAF